LTYRSEDAYATAKLTEVDSILKAASPAGE
jgi:hypothetical protein